MHNKYNVIIDNFIVRAFILNMGLYLSILQISMLFDKLKPEMSLPSFPALNEKFHISKLQRPSGNASDLQRENAPSERFLV